MADNIRVYGAGWCGDTVRTLRHLDKSGIQYDYVDIDQNAEGERKVIDFNRGKRRIPLVEIGDKALSVPSAQELDEALS
jgi:glutaredoxin